LVRSDFALNTIDAFAADQTLFGSVPATIAEKSSVMEHSSNGPTQFVNKRLWRSKAERAPGSDIYITSEEIGDGSFGNVYAGFYGNTPVAIKTFKPHPAGAVSKTGVAEALKEASIWLSLRHPNIAILYTIAHEANGYPILVIERFQMDLLQRLHTGSPPTLVARLNWLLDIAYAYKYLHTLESPVYHRDLKPNNVLLDANGRAAIADFGMSKVHSMYAYSKQRQPKIGHYAYAPPESFIRGYKVESGYDVYSFGMTMYEVLGRLAPFSNMARDPKTVIQLVKDGQRPGREETVDFISDECWGLIEKCWAQNAVNRPDFGTICNTLLALVEQQQV
ncbi:hypothetical protein HDU99_005019, partial [Rhizoclosmatium hyalinum]